MPGESTDQPVADPGGAPHFEHVRTVRFHEVDRAGIAFFGRVFEYCHESFEECLRVADDSLEAIFDEGGWSMPLVHAEADYTKPMRMGDRLRVRLEVERLGAHSITIRYALRGEGGDLRAKARLVHAFVDIQTFESVETPDRIVTALRACGLI